MKPPAAEPTFAETMLYCRSFSVLFFDSYSSPFKTYQEKSQTLIFITWIGRGRAIVGVRLESGRDQKSAKSVRRQRRTKGGQL